MHSLFYGLEFGSLRRTQERWTEIVHAIVTSKLAVLWTKVFGIGSRPASIAKFIIFSPILR